VTPSEPDDPLAERLAAARAAADERAQAIDSARRPRRGRWTIASAVAVVLLAVGGLLLAASGDDEDEGAQPAPPTTTTTTTRRRVTTTTSEPPTTTTPPLPAPTPPVGAPPAPGTTAVVAPGESFWSIAAAQVASQLGRPPAAEEVVGYWSALIAANEERLVEPGNADLLHVGQVLTLP
jgi:hypothetical protein